MGNSDRSATPTWKQFNHPWYAKLGLGIAGYFKNVGIMIWHVIKSIPFKLWALILAIGHGFKGLWLRFKNGDWRTRLSYLIMGFGNFSRGPKQFIVGFLYLAVEALFVVFMVFSGAGYLVKLGTLGTIDEYFDYDANGEWVKFDGDNSLKILIFSVLAIAIIIFFIIMYVQNTKSAFNVQQRVQNGQGISSPKDQFNNAMNDNYHITVLALPVLGVLIITVLPLICNILVAFTNFNYLHSPPSDRFWWTGFEAFKTTFQGSYGILLWRTLGWTLVWAFFATFTNFFFGMFLAMIINKKSIKMKVFWRTCFVIVIAVPDFVSLMMMGQFFSYSNSNIYTGAFNHIIREWFHIKTGVGGVNWLGGEAWVARIMVIVINLWRGMPFTMLSTMGILMNIPEDLYESSRIDGAGPVRRFISITFPYIMFVMGPQLITTFTGNINNFNVIFFLTGGGPFTNIGGVRYGATNLLITWLYSLTMQDTALARYNIGSVIGIFTFIITAFFALIVFNSSKSNTQEDTFQ